MSDVRMESQYCTSLRLTLEVQEVSEDGFGAWGVVPQPVVEVLARLQRRLSQAVLAMNPSAIEGEAPREHDNSFLRMAHAANVADRVSNDYRSIFNAYVHRYHRPKPPIGELARAQDTITQTFAKRYTSKTIAAIDALLSEQPDLEAIRQGIRTLGFEDLWNISPTLDRAMNAAIEDPRFKKWQPYPRTGDGAAHSATDEEPDLDFFLKGPLTFPPMHPSPDNHPATKL